MAVISETRAGTPLSKVRNRRMPNSMYGGVGGKGAKENLSLPDLPDFFCYFPDVETIKDNWRLLRKVLENTNIFVLYQYSIVVYWQI